jgi:pimeloyl-ACP methyl ester carboxylesterase
VNPVPRVLANGIELEYETFGDPAAAPLLLIAGLDAQMISWDDRFCRLLAAAGFLVIRFDNRDNGLSAKLDDAPAPDIGALLTGNTSSAPYRLADMAADAAGLLTALGYRQAHVVGASMGGMIAQCMAIDYPDRVLSLCSIMSTTGAPGVGEPADGILDALMAPAPGGRDQVIETWITGARLIGSPGYAFDDRAARELAARCYDRSFCPQGTARQFAAILASPDRTDGLRQLTIPALVIHGDSDPLVGPSGGAATAAAIPGSEMLVIQGMGHDLPACVWKSVTSAIAANARQATGRRVHPQPSGSLLRPPPT